MMSILQSRFLTRHLDPGSSLGEVLFGLIMTLTFTLGAGLMLQEEGAEGARELLIATIGCNIAWGIIDGALYIIGQVFDRGRLMRLGQKIRQTPDADAAREIVGGELDELLEPMTSAEERRQLYTRVVEQIRQRPAALRGSVTKADLLGALVCFWLVFVASFPAAIPFFFIDEPWVALRVSNAVLLGLLFYTGFAWAKHTVAKPWVSGLAFLLGGLGLVVVAIALGG